MIFRSALHLSQYGMRTTREFPDSRFWVIGYSGPEEYIGARFSRRSVTTREEFKKTQVLLPN